MKGPEAQRGKELTNACLFVTWGLELSFRASTVSRTFGAWNTFKQTQTAFGKDLSARCVRKWLCGQY